MSTLTLIEGSQPYLGATQTILLPEAHTDLKDGDKVLLENDGHVLIGRATVKTTQVKCFAKLTDTDFIRSILPEADTLSNALTALKAKVKGFSQVDAVTLIAARIDSLAVSGEAVI